MKPDVTLLLLCSCACLIGLLASFLMLLRAQRRIKQRDQRIESQIGAYRAAHVGPEAASYRLALERQGASLLQRAARLLRYDRAHQSVYPVRPIVVLSIALLVAAAIARASVDLIGTIGWLTLPLGWALGTRWFYGWCEDRHVATLFRQFPDALAMIVRVVRVGLPIVEALRVVARENPSPTSDEFTALVAQTSIGVPLDDALREMATRNRLPEYRFFATALSLQSQTGGGLAEALENLADTIRKRLAARLRGHALAAEARMSAYILGALPIVAGTLLVLINYSYMNPLFTDPAGRKLLLSAIGLLCLGALIMRTMIRKSLT